MNRKETVPPATEGEYPGIAEVLEGYLTGERLIDEILEHPDFLKTGERMCCAITRNGDAGRDLFQRTCVQCLERDREGPSAGEALTESDGSDECDAARRVPSLRAAGIVSTDDFRLWFYTAARKLARSGWRKEARRRKILQLVPEPVEDHHVRANVVSPEASCQLAEFCEQISVLPEKKRRAIEYWLLGYPNRQIAKKLTAEGEKCNHVSVGAWIEKEVRKFRDANSAADSQKKAS